MQEDTLEKSKNEKRKTNKADKNKETLLLLY